MKPGSTPGGSEVQHHSPPPQLPAGLAAEIQHLVSFAISKSEKAYQSGFKRWRRHLRSYGAESRCLNPTIDDCRAYLATFVNPKSARQYVAHITHFMNAAGHYPANNFRTDQVKQIFRSLMKRNQIIGPPPKPKPFFTDTEAFFLIKTLRITEFPLSCVARVLLNFGLRAPSECFPLKFSTHIGPWKQKDLPKFHAFRIYRPEHKAPANTRFPTFTPRPVADTYHPTRKNLPGGSILLRECLCCPSIAELPLENFSRFEEINPLCVVHGMLEYFSVMNITQNGQDIFPPYPNIMYEAVPLHLGGPRTPNGKGRVVSQAALAFVVKKVVLANPLQFPRFDMETDVPAMASHMFRRSMANMLYSRVDDKSFYKSGDWTSRRGPAAYVTRDTVVNKTILAHLTQHEKFDLDSDDDDDLSQDPNNSPLDSEEDVFKDVPDEDADDDAYGYPPPPKKRKTPPTRITVPQSRKSSFPDVWPFNDGSGPRIFAGDADEDSPAISDVIEEPPAINEVIEKTHRTSWIGTRTPSGRVANHITTPTQPPKDVESAPFSEALNARIQEALNTPAAQPKRQARPRGRPPNPPAEIPDPFLSLLDKRKKGPLDAFISVIGKRRRSPSPPTEY